MFSPQQSYWLVVDIMSFVPLGTITMKNTSNDNCYIGDFSYHVFFPMEPVLYRENRTTYVFSDQTGEISSPVFSPRPNFFFPTLGKSHIMCFSRSYWFLRSVRRNLIVCVSPRPSPIFTTSGNSHIMCFSRSYRFLRSFWRNLIVCVFSETVPFIHHIGEFSSINLEKSHLLCFTRDHLHCFLHLIFGKISSIVFSPTHSIAFHT